MLKTSHVILLLALTINASVAVLDVQNALAYAVRQYSFLSSQLAGENNASSAFIYTGDPTSPTWNTNEVTKWTVGFYGGTLWTLYKLTKDNYWKHLALEFQERVKVRQDDTSTHDVGFIITSTYGLCLDYSPEYRDLSVPVILQAAKSLSSRFHPLAKVIRSWENDEGHGGVPGEVKVVADNMMNLELLYRASALSGNVTLADMATSHANRTIEQHFRRRDSSNAGIYHVVAYWEGNGTLKRRYNWQGLADESTWARGLAWVIHGLTTSYILTNSSHPQFLEYAMTSADYFLSHLPEDGVPYWDFDANHTSSYQPRDTSAAAIAAHGLLKLYSITKAKSDFEGAERILESLNSAKYRSDGDPRYRIHSILVNGTQFHKEGNLNTAIVYGDFYFLQALDLYVELREEYYKDSPNIAATTFQAFTPILTSLGLLSTLVLSLQP